MKRVILLVGTILILCVAVSAQQAATGLTGKGVKLGIGIAGINTSSAALDSILDSRVGISVGAFATYSFTPQFAVQPEILYVGKGAQKDLFFISAHWNIDYLEIPVLGRFDIAPQRPVHPHLLAGPALSILLSSKFHFMNEEVDVSDGMKTMDVGLVFGGGVDFKRITFDARYTLGLVNTIDAAKVNALTGAEPGDFYYLDGDPSAKNTSLSFMLGIRF